MKKFHRSIQLLLCPFLFALLLSSAANATIYPIFANYTGAQAGTFSVAKGVIAGSYNDVTKTISFSLIFGNLNPSGQSYSAHFHAPAGPGTDAPVIIDFTGFPLGKHEGSYTNSYVITPLQETQLFAGLWYSDIHSPFFDLFGKPEIRAQIILGDPATEYIFDDTYSGAQVVPPTGFSGTGRIIGSYNTVSKVISYALFCQNLSSASPSIHGADFHAPAPAGQNADAIIDFPGFISNGLSTATYFNSNVLTTEQESWLLSNLFYTDIHTAFFMNGEIRAQITPYIPPVTCPANTITVTQVPHGTITPGTKNIKCGDDAAYTVTPDPCYHITDVQVDGHSVGAVSQYTFTNVHAAHTVTALYAANTSYHITVTQTAKGTITPGSQTVNCGDSKTYTITPAPCYHITDVHVDGHSVGAVSHYTFSNVHGNHTIVAYYAINLYLITVTQTPHGSIYTGTRRVNCGDNEPFTITPASSYHIADVKVDGHSVGAVSKYVFNDVHAPHTITATYALNTGVYTRTEGANTDNNLSTGKPTLRSNIFNVTVAPNVTTTEFHIKIQSGSNEPVNIRVMDAAGRLLGVINNVRPNADIILGQTFKGGSYFAEVVQGANHKTVKLIKL